MQTLGNSIDDQGLGEWSEGHFRRLRKSTQQNQNTTTTAATPSSSSNGRPDISWPLERPRGGADEPFSPRVEKELRRRSISIKENLLGSSQEQDPQFSDLTVPLKDLLPGHARSQAGIATRAWLLGQLLGISVLLASYALWQDSRLWRPAFFVACLSLFHFLEFYTHARFNLPNATISAFLLFGNGPAYEAAHSAALLESLVTSLYFPSWQDKFQHIYLQYLGFALIIMGQVVRSLAMAKAGTNFNHQVQRYKADTHVLVTDGLYGILRHPSYFGFFWWALGTQVLLGNAVCFWVFAGVLWVFFNNRIHAEEGHLTRFFGREYVFYRSYTHIGIPFIRSKDYPQYLHAEKGDGDDDDDGDKGKEE